MPLAAVKFLAISGKKFACASVSIEKLIETQAGEFTEIYAQH